jgi:hypothetical protein
MDYFTFISKIKDQFILDFKIEKHLSMNHQRNLNFYWFPID